MRGQFTCLNTDGEDRLGKRQVENRLRAGAIPLGQ